MSTIYLKPKHHKQQIMTAKRGRWTILKTTHTHTNNLHKIFSFATQHFTIKSRLHIQLLPCRPELPRHLPVDAEFRYLACHHTGSICG